MIIKRVMTHNPIFVHPDLSVNDARALMDKEKVGRLPVLDKNGSLAGIVTRKDMIKAGPSPATTLDIYEISYLLAKLKVEKIMQRHVITVDEDEVVEEAARVMVDRNIGCLPVMRGSLLVGIVTVEDIFRVFINAFAARHAGVRITVMLDEKPGQLALLAGGIAEKGGNILSFIFGEGDDQSRVRATCKIVNISASDVEAVVAGIPNAQLEDLR
jgi:acetoin utilization protein AcuB